MFIKKFNYNYQVSWRELHYVHLDGKVWCESFWKIECPTKEQNNLFFSKKKQVEKKNNATSPSCLTDTMESVKGVLGRWGKKVGEATKKAEDLAGNTWQHCKSFLFHFLGIFELCVCSGYISELYVLVWEKVSAMMYLVLLAHRVDLRLEVTGRILALRNLWL